jgi:hypothetical protein
MAAAAVSQPWLAEVPPGTTSLIFTRERLEIRSAFDRRGRSSGLWS